MFKINFDLFMNILEVLKLDYSRPSPTIHYSENDNRFILYIKGLDFWKVYTMVFKKDIIEFGESIGMDSAMSLVQFRMNYLTHAVPVIEEVFFNSPEHIFKPRSKNAELKKDIDPGEDMIDESKSYDDFIVKNFEKWEQRALNAIDKVDIKKGFVGINKTFGEFLQELFNGINSLVFQRGSKKFINQEMKEGLKEAEQDTKIDISISETFNQKVETLADQELNGYTIHGKKWHGMKGVTHELRQDILNSIRDGVINKESREQLKERVKDKFKIAKDSQAERIARTETTRFVNEGKLQGFKDSGVEGRKTWLIVDDDVTSEVCKRLDRRYKEKGVGFDEPFRDEKTGKEYMNPPAHPSCRSVIGFELPEKGE